jgi:hypothetical protein
MNFCVSVPSAADMLYYYELSWLLTYITTISNVRPCYTCKNYTKRISTYACPYTVPYIVSDLASVRSILCPQRCLGCCVFIKAAYESSSTLFFSALFGRNEELPTQFQLIQDFLTSRPTSHDSKSGLCTTPATKVIRYSKMTLILWITLPDWRSRRTLITSQCLQRRDLFSVSEILY